MVRSRKSKSSKKKGSSRSQLVSLPTEVIKSLGWFLNLALPPSRSPHDGRRKLQKDLRALSSTCSLFFDFFKSDRYHSLRLGGDLKDLEFIALLSKHDDKLLLVLTLQIENMNPIAQEFHEPFATFISRLRSLKVFFFSSDGSVPPLIVQAMSNPRRHPHLDTVRLFATGLSSLEEFVKARSLRGKPSFSSLRQITLAEEPPDALLYPGWMKVRESEEYPRWLAKHPKNRWAAVEHRLLHQVSQLLSRSSLTLEVLKLEFDPQFEPFQFGNDVETNVHTMLSISNGVLCRDPARSHPSPLAFPRLVELTLPSTDVGSPFVRTLFRNCPLLRILTIIHHSLLGQSHRGVTYVPGSLSSLEMLDVRAYHSTMDELEVDPLWNFIRLPSPTILRKLHLRVDSLGLQLLTFIRGRFLALEDLLLHSSTWVCTMDVVRSTVSSLPSLMKVAFDFPPSSTKPPFSPPNADQLTRDDYEHHSAHYALDYIRFFFAKPINRSHFVNIVSNIIGSSASSLESVTWTFDAKLTLKFVVSEGSMSNSPPSIEVEFSHYELDLRAEDEDEWDEEMREAGFGGPGEMEAGEDEENEDATNSSPRSSPPLDSPPDTSTSIAGSSPNNPLLPSAKSNSTSSPPKPAVEPSTQTHSLVDATSSPSHTSPPPAPLPSDPPSPHKSDDSSSTDPPITPELDGSFERREKRLVSILPSFEDDEDDQPEEGSSSSRNAEAQVGSGEGAQVDRFWENWVFLFELD